jgi:hypothetical protein
MTKTIKASRVTILLGEIPVNVYQMPDASYRLSGRNVTDAIGEDHNTLARFYGVKSLKDLPGAGLERDKISAGKEGSPFIPVVIEDATRFWFDRSKKGNALAGAIVEAALIEAIERRADKAFGKARSEEEYNDRFKSRMDGILTRRSLTDAVRDYMMDHPELSENAIKFMYSNITDATYRSIFGRSCKKLESDLHVERHKLRDALTVKELNHLNAFEDLATRLIDEHGYTPTDAVHEAEKRLLIKKHDRIAA